MNDVKELERPAARHDEPQNKPSSPKKPPRRGKGVAVRRYYTVPGIHPFEKIEWERRVARLTDVSGKVIFEQADVEVPTFWSQTATNIVAQKYFHGALDTPQREQSVKHLIDRVARTIAEWGRQDGYFSSDEDAESFYAELAHLLAMQKASFNSPVWFNVGVQNGARPQCSACFINSVDDTMESILDLAKTEGILFKYGSGTGTNLSPLRSSKERLSGGGKPSGPVSFMKGYDAFAGVIKCLTPDTYIYTTTGMIRMGEFISASLPEGFHPDDQVILATEQGKQRISHVYVSPESDIWRVTLGMTGLELKGTAEHPVLTMNQECQLVWKTLGQIEQGDYVAVARHIDCWAENMPTFEAFSPELVVTRKQITYPTRMTPELARLLGYMVSEGCMDEHRVRFVNADKEVFDDFLSCFSRVFGVDVSEKFSTRINPKTGVVTYLFQAEWKGVVQFFKYVGLTCDYSNRKIVPQSILRSPKEIAVEFLRAYFEGDGHVSRLVYCASASEELLRQIQQMLLNFGIISVLRRKRIGGVMYFYLNMQGAEAKAYMERIGFVSRKKQQALHLPEKRNTNIDVVPYLVEALRNRSQSCNGYYACSDGRTRKIPFGFFNRTSQHISYARLEETADVIPAIRLLDEQLAETVEWVMKQKFFWDRVAAKELAGRSKTYDVTVPETHSFIANGIVCHNSGGKTRRAAKMVILNMEHPDIEEYITCKATEEKKAHALIDMGYNPDIAYESVFFQNANNSVRVTDAFMQAALEKKIWQTKAITTGEIMGEFQAKTLLQKIAESTHLCGDPGMQYDTTINAWHTCPNSGRIDASNPCAEYLFVNNSACNLSSLNVMRFRSSDGEFDAESFTHAVDIMIIAQDIIVDNSSYPTRQIEENSHLFRPLGLGYTNLGALLMARGLPYDSDAGRAYAAAITAILCGQAYKTSAMLARARGVFEAYAPNAAPMLNVIRKHGEAVNNIDAALVPPELIAAAQAVWRDALESGQQAGFRNAQVTVLAPTGTISFMMDCDTTGIEPELALIKYKHLAGGGSLKMINGTVPEALARLGYADDEQQAILAHLEQRDTIENAPFLKRADLSVFDCAFPPKNGQRVIHYMGHLKMMAAVQPFISGGISKTVNVPNSATVEEITDAYVTAWKLGLKAVAIYRDGSKRMQPLTTSTTQGKPKPETIVEFKPVRRRLPDEREAMTKKFSVAGHKGYVTVGMYEDGAPGELFIVMSKEGSTISGLMDGFATAISLALQYGVPLHVLVNKFAHTRFEPAGFTGDKDIPIAKSILDYIFRWLALKFLTQADRPNVLSDAPTLTQNGHAEAAQEWQMQTSSRVAEAEQRVFQEQADAPPCSVCGAIMVRSGTCYKCLNCGTTSGCS